MYFYYDLDSTSPPGSSLAGDRNRVIQFLGDVKSFLSRLTKHSTAFVNGMHTVVVDAWSAAESRFDHAATVAKTATDEALHNSGLRGAELKLKLRNVEHAFGELITMYGGDTLRRFFNTINSLLKSIAEALGIGTALEEIKDAIRDALDWART
ncbi:MAG: hypothetical protein V4795_02305 [Pseudomonadota bacterium]